MKLRLIKPGMSPPIENHRRRPIEVPIIDTLRSWVREFQSTKAERAQLDFQRISNSRK